MIRRCRVQLLTGGKAAFAQAWRIDTRRPDPRVRRRPLRRGPNPVLQLTNRSQVLKWLHGLGSRHAEGMHVRIDQPGDDRPATPVDHAGRGADASAHLGSRSDGDEASTAHGEGLRHPEPVIDGQDLRVEDDEIGRFHGALPSETAAQCGNQRSDGHASQHPSHSSRWARTKSSSARCG